MKQSRKLIKHIRHCRWGIRNVREHNKKWYTKRKSYYFKKQIEVAEKLLKQLEK